MRIALCLTVTLALCGATTDAFAAKLRQDTYEASIGSSVTTGSARANFSGFAKRAYVTSQDLGATCVVQLRAQTDARVLFTSDPLSTGVTTLLLNDLPIAERTQWHVTTGAQPATTQTVTIRLVYDAND